MTLVEPVVWHDLECGSYVADVPLWEGLAEDAGGPVLELGCGTGRVGLRLAASGRRVLGLDVDPDLVSTFDERARGLPASAEVADARAFELSERFALAIAPMQFVQLLAGAAERTACLACVAAHLRSGGRAALAIAEDVAPGTTAVADRGGSVAAMPDVREAGGCVYSSLPLEIAVGDREVVVRRLRQTVTPAGNLREAVDEVRLRRVSASTVEAEARAAGLRPAGRREIPPTDLHTGSTVVVLERAD